MDKPRLVVLTDITSLTAGVREPDDGQSLIRLLLYSNDIDIEGLIASSNLGHGQVVRPELIHEVVEAYDKCLPNLLLHSPNYPFGQQLHAIIKAGQPKAAPKVDISESIGPDKETEASQWIVKCVDREDPRPLWISLWGGGADLAQALYTVSSTRSPEEVAFFVGKIKVHACGDQDSTCEWMKASFPTLWYATRCYGYRGMYRGGDTTLVSSEWVKEHIHGHGALGELYPDYNGGDPWGKVSGIKEGDTPTYLGLIPNGLNMPSEPGRCGWGGRIVNDKVASRLVDVSVSAGTSSDIHPSLFEVYRWRDAYQRDFQSRLDWLVKSKDHASHHPIVSLNPDTSMSGQCLAVSPGQRLTLDASSSYDIDGRTLSFYWTLLHEESSFVDGHSAGDNGVRLTGAKQLHDSQIEVIIDDHATGLAAVLLAVTNDGNPPVTRYTRIDLDIVS